MGVGSCRRSTSSLHHFVTLFRALARLAPNHPTRRRLQMLALYFSPGACSTASHIALEEAGAQYEERPTLLAKGEHKTPEYTKINPRGKVPALEVDGQVITENTAILTYIARRFPEKKLQIGRASCREKSEND